MPQENASPVNLPSNNNAEMAPAANVVTPSVAPQKPRQIIGLWIGVGVAVLLLAGAGGAYAWWSWWNTPQKVASDLIANAYGVTKAQIDAQMVVSSLSQSPDQQVSLSWDSKNSIDAPEYSGENGLSVDYSGKKYTLSVGTALDKQGSIYVKIGGIESLLGNLQESLTDYGLSWTPFKPFVTWVDNQWWQIDVQELVGRLDDAELQTQVGNVSDYVDCVTTVVKNEDWSELKVAYVNNPYILLQKVSGPMAAGKNQDWYRVELDAEKLAAYSNQILTSKYAQAIQDCQKQYQSEASASQSEAVTAQELREQLKLDEMPPIYLLVGRYDHQLARIYVQETSLENQVRVALDISLSYPQTQVVHIPTDAKPVGELITAAEELWQETESLSTGTLSQAKWLDQDDPWLLAQQVQTRNQKRIQDISKAARALETCYDSTSRYYGLAGSGTFYATPGEVSGPFAMSENQCLSADLVPADSEHPYYYTLLGDTMDGPIWAYALCVELEPQASSAGDAALGILDGGSGNAERYVTLADFDYDTWQWQDTDSVRGSFYCQTAVGE